MAKYVLKHGSLKIDVNQFLHPRTDPAKPRVVELDPIEAFRMGGDGSLQLLSEYEAERKGAAPKPAGSLGEAQYAHDRAHRVHEWDPKASGR